MTLKNSEQISQRKDLGNDLSAGIGVVLEDVASGYGGYLAPVVAEGETLFDTRQQLVLIQRRIDGHVKDLEALDVGVVAKVHDTDKVNSEIDDLAGVVVSKMRSLRHTTRGAYGNDGVARTGLKGHFSLRPLRVYERARLVQASLQNPDLGLKPVLKAVSNGDAQVEEETKGLVPADLAAELEPEVTRLGERLKARYSDKRENVDARYLRKRGIREFDRHIRAIVPIVKGIFVLAGRDDLAKRFTTNLPRFIRRASEEPAVPPTESQEPPSEPAADSTSTP